jgi:hypothetical protein
MKFGIRSKVFSILFLFTVHSAWANEVHAQDTDALYVVAQSLDALTAQISDQDAATKNPKMGECQFYVQVDAEISGKKRKVWAGAGGTITLGKGATLNAECRGTCDTKGPHGKDCECGYMTIDGMPQHTGIDADGNPIIESLTTIHGCHCVEPIEELSPAAIQ